jgi:DNA-directed RNA polymerase specialized sigma24 family protein
MKPGADTPVVESLLRGLLAILVADREERINGATTRRTELVLADAGLSIGEVAKLTGKNYQAVQKAVVRAKAKQAAALAAEGEVR